MDYKIAQRLQECRKAHHLSQEELADKLGVSRQAVSKWERGEASPDTDNLIALSRLYEISLDELIGEKNIGTQESVELTSSNQIAKKERKEEEEEEHLTPKQKLITTIVSGCTSLLVTIIYLVMGFCFNLWGKCWLIFLLIPIVGSLCDASIKKNAKHFAYPVLVAGIYLVIGVTTNLWHPFWILFLTIPLYYMIIDIITAYKKTNQQ